MTAFSIEDFGKERITERLYDAMADALYRQGLLTEAQRRELCAILQRDVLRPCDRR